MATKQQKLGPVTADERQKYLARLGSDLKWGRPTAKTAGFVWTLLKDRFPHKLGDLMPKSKSRTRPSGAEYDQAVLTAKQSLVIALDCAISAGDRSKMLTQNLLLAALAKYWSIRFRRANRAGAGTLYDVSEETAKRVWRELLLAGVRIDTLWQVAAGAWSKTEDARNPLYWVRRVHSPRQRHALGWSVNVRPDSLALRAFEGAVQEDQQYRRRNEFRLLFAEDWKPHLRRVRQGVCAERPYNVVNLADGSERVLAILEQTRVKFNVEVFRDDYKTVVKYVDAHRPSTRLQWREYRKLRTFVSSYRRVYQDTENIPLETIDEWEQWGDRPGDGGWRPEHLSGHRWIRSRFFRGLHRRFYASDFWPEHTPKIFRGRWFGVWVHAPEVEDIYSGISDDLPERIVTEASPAQGRFINRDISSSQTQILAVFLGLRELEDLATSTSPKFKEWLAQQLWALHEKTAGGLLADGYAGAGDSRLVDFTKAHWMRLMYGSELHTIIRRLRKEPTKYGPGWRTGVDDALTFLTSLPPWLDDVTNFLAMSKHLADTYYLKDGDINRGVVFHDPLDGAEVRWHHARRGRQQVSFGHYKVEIHPPGVNVRKVFWPLPPGTINRRELGQFIPPCLIHMLDAFFSGLVIRGLRAEGITDIIAVHDGWFVPQTFQTEDGSILNGQDALESVIGAAGAEWFEGLKDIYDRLVYYLGDDPTFGAFVHEIRGRWDERVKARRWPTFTAD